MSANLAMKVPAHVVEAANAVLMKRVSGDPRQAADVETYLLKAILRTIETDTAELGLPPKLAFSPRPG